MSPMRPQQQQSLGYARVSSRQKRLHFASLFVGLVLSASIGATETEYAQELVAWRTAHSQRLQGEEGWLTIAGLHWLNEGENRIGTDSTNDLVLHTSTAPARIGSFNVHQGKVTFCAENGIAVKQRGDLVHTAALIPGPGTGAAPADALVVGTLTLWLHQSGERLAIRVRDPQSPLRTGFSGCKWFPGNPEYRVSGRFLPYDSPKAVTMPNIMGDAEHYTSPGVVQFELQGKSLSLQPVLTREDRLFFVFRDQTSGKETYGAARFLVTDGARDGQVQLDFNKAVNPPCAYNPYTTCPLPLKENILPIPIEAGELLYK